MRRTRAWLILLALLIAACGGGGDDDEEAQDEERPRRRGAVDTVEEVESATVQVQTTGTFTDPEVGLQTDVAGSGSGFIIDPSGIAVTNNHVVTGAATLEVLIGGEDESRSAKVLGVSECADLAVIDIDGGGYPFVEWYDQPIRVNLDVRAAGFPLGDPEYTLTRGIVSKAEADGETEWASVDSVIEHDARINPGSSGGPLVDERGRVVGVNYAGDPSTDQNFAIAADQARRIVSRLRQRQNVDALGVNGQAVFDEEAEITGVWVASVDSGSPADEAGIQDGDIITRLEDLTLATEGTMKEYCDVIQSHDPDDVISVEVLRYATEEVLEGQLNGDELEQSFSFAEELREDVAGADPGATYDEYVKITDDSEAIEVEVPAEWSDVDGSATELGPTVIAATDIEGFNNAWDAPGMLFIATSQVADSEPDALLDELGQEDCTSQGREDYSDPLYTGRYEFFSDCAGTDTAYAVVVAVPEDRAYTTVVGVQLVSDRDLDALDHVLDTFQVVGDV